MMKHMTTIAALCALTLLLAIGCGGKGGSGSAAPIVGAWKIVEASGQMAEMNKGTIYEFKDSGTLVVSKSGMKSEFSYTTTNDQVFWKMGKDFRFNATFKITGGRMNFDFGTSDQKFVMERQ